jgi:anti-sigma B factor antagonist
MESSTRCTLGDDGTASVTVRGEVDYANFEELAACMRTAVEDWTPSAVRVDLSDAVFIDSTGLGALIEGYQAATAAEIPFVVVNPTDAFRRILEVTGLAEFWLEQPTEPAELTGA